MILNPVGIGWQRLDGAQADDAIRIARRIDGDLAETRGSGLLLRGRTQARFPVGYYLRQYIR